MPGPEQGAVGASGQPSGICRFRRSRRAGTGTDQGGKDRDQTLAKPLAGNVEQIVSVATPLPEVQRVLIASGAG